MIDRTITLFLPLKRAKKKCRILQPAILSTIPISSHLSPSEQQQNLFSLLQPNLLSSFLLFTLPILSPHSSHILPHILTRNRGHHLIQVSTRRLVVRPAPQARPGLAAVRRQGLTSLPPCSISPTRARLSAFCCLTSVPLPFHLGSFVRCVSM